MGGGSGAVRVEVLGPVRVLDGDRDVTPAGALQRRLLALLVLRRGRAVSTDAAVDALWPDGAPHNPAGALQNHVSRLRAVLPAGAIESVADGYRLDPDAVDLDCERLAGLLADGAAAELAAVLARWHGPAFPELADVDDGRAETTRLEELRTRAREVCAEHRLARGDTDGLVAELRALADEEPLRERPRALLMDALAATGRHADALRVFDEFRRRLGEELGIEPSPALVAQHAALLAAVPGHPRPPASALPLPVTSLVGRDQLVDDVLALAAAQRLVTLVGPGGAGKTRVLLEVGRRLQSAVALCELSAADAGSVETVVASSLGIDPRPGVSLADQAGSVLGESELVLLVDNCEHVIDDIAALVDRLLARCPGLRVIATSRERLRVTGEHVRVVPMLATDGDESPAVRLFLERGGAALGELAPGDGELASIRDIVRRLDGLPLAIELAAARLFTHDLDELAAGLDHRFALLAGHRATGRHASLGAAVSWSFDALDESLRDVFTAVSAFAAPFTADDAAAVCDRTVAATAAALSELCERSLVTRAPGRRYALLETLRAFGAEQLAGAGRAETVAARHARHFVEWAEDANRRLLVPSEPAIADIDAAVPELHVAFGWLLDHGDVDRAGRLIAALLDYGMFRLRPDVVGWAERVTAADPDGASPLAPHVWAAAAYAAWMAGDLAETGVRTDRALAAAERLGRTVPSVARIRGNYELFEGRLDTALEWYRRAVRAASEAADEAQYLIAAATTLLALGYAGDAGAAEHAQALLDRVGDDETPHAAHAWYCSGEADLAVDVERARLRLSRAVDVAERTGGAFVAGLAGASLASIEATIGDPADAAQRFRTLIDHWRRAGMWSTQWTMLRSIAALLHRLGRDRDAAVLLGAIHTTRQGHRVFGADEVALRELDARLRAALGDGYRAAHDEGAALDGDRAVEHALRAL